ncbi:MAG: branched-chain amino acid ABC transporter permease [Burkholderiales bacterium]|uniref:branched-chain amino acid ABC transporter permease n=1 Tax=Casimicrobium huifangae TaxID=2591109 RepID=UPI0012EB9C01|nr:branched-chain amino acid ABC transporter permease [Casimicrobium huifangae]
MDFSIAALLAQDGLTNGAIYCLLALALVLVFAVTRVIFVPQGEFVAFTVLTLAAFEQNKLPGTVWLLLALGVTAAVAEVLTYRSDVRRMLRAMAGSALPSMVAAALVWGVHAMQAGFLLQVLATVLAVTAMGPAVYRLAFQPVATAPVLTLLIVSVAVHFVLTGLGLLFFGAEGARTSAFTNETFSIGGINISGQSLLVYAFTAVLVVAMGLFFKYTLFGKALRATAANRTGARLVGVSPNFAGSLSITLAAAIGAMSGLLIGPITTVYYDSGFLVGLKGFVGAIVGGLASYPIAAAGAIFVGLIESFSSFWASAYKEVIVFTLILPILLWRSLTTHHHEEE